MISLRHPVGPHPPATYWRRRSAVLAVLVGLLYLLLHSCGGSEPKKTIRTGATPKPTATIGLVPPTGPFTSTPGASPGGSAAGGDDPADPADTGGTIGSSGGTGTRAGAGTGSGTGGAATAADRGPNCGDNLRVVTRTDQRVYTAGEQPRITLVVRNTGTVPCRVEVGLGQAQLLITSGSDRIWSSVDCARGQGSIRPVVKPGQAYLVLNLAWARVRSAKGCPAGQPAARPGTYLVSGGLTSLANINRAVFGLR